jgi:hypothetical protein
MLCNAALMVRLSNFVRVSVLRASNRSTIEGPLYIVPSTVSV